MTKQRKRPGPATVMTPEVVDKLEEAFAWGCSDVEACLWANIATATLYKYQEKNPGFAERKAELKEKPIMVARKSVVDGMAKSPELALKFLERKNKKEFALRNELTGADGENLGVAISAEQADQLIRARAKRADS